MKTLFKKIGLFILLGLSIVSCTPNDPTDGNQNPPKEVNKLLAIKSDATGNACNSWNLQNANPVSSITTSPSFSFLRTADAITSPAVLLAQTTMTWQSSAYDNVNKKYAVALGETVVIYDLSSSTVPAPTTYVVAPSGSGSSTYVFAMEYIGGQLFVEQNNQIKKFNSGVLTPIGVSLPTIGVTSNTMSNMTKNGNNIYFILKGKLYTFDTTSLTITSTVSVSGWSSDIDYNGLEYFSGKIYCTKRFSSTTFSTTDQFVSIDLSGFESIITISPYVRDWSRISSALDPTTGIYYLSSSNGFGSSTNTLTEINLTTGTNASYSISGYQFGLQYKD